MTFDQMRKAVEHAERYESPRWSYRVSNMAKNKRGRKQIICLYYVFKDRGYLDKNKKNNRKSKKSKPKFEQLTLFNLDDV